MIVLALVLQAAASYPPAPPLPVVETPDYWRSLQPNAFWKRERVLCRRIGEVSAEFAYRDGKVSSAEITGLGHRLSTMERATLDRALAGLGWLVRVSIGCNAEHDALITVTALPYLDGTRSVVRTLSIVWAHDGMTGLGGKRLPEQEIGPDLYRPQ